MSLKLPPKNCIKELTSDTTLNIILGYFIYYSIFVLLIALLFANLLGLIDNKFVLITAGIVLFFIAAFRAPGIDKDYLSYVSSFKVIQNPSDYFLHYKQFQFFEPFYYLIPAITKSIFNSDLFIYFTFPVFTFFSIAIKFRAIQKMSSFPALSVLLFFPLYFFLHEMTQMRAAVVSSCLLVAIYAHCNRRYWLFTIITLFSMMFQYTSILIPLILLLSPNKFQIKRIAIFISLALVTGILFANQLISLFLQLNISFAQKLAASLFSYDSNNNQLHFFNAVFPPGIFLTIWLIINREKIFQKNKYAYLLIKVQVLSLLSFVILSPIAVVAFRLSEFFGIVSLITFPLIVYTFRSKLVSYSVLIFYSLLLLIVDLHFTKIVQAYDTIFSLK